jgi:NTP pyrophosphatase (non-canonical NTP hydrolase)
MSIPPYDGRYDREIKVFVDTMKVKLAANYNKGRWENVNLADALDALFHEVEELRDAIKTGNVAEIMMEGADCGVWGMIISTIAIEQALGKVKPSLTIIDPGDITNLRVGKYEKYDGVDK